MPLNLTPGTRGSIDMLEALYTANDDMLYGDLQVIVDYKWGKDKSKIQLKAAFSIFHMLVLVAHLTAFYDSNIIVWILLFLTVIYSF